MTETGIPRLTASYQYSALPTVCIHCQHDIQEQTLEKAWVLVDQMHDIAVQLTVLEEIELSSQQFNTVQLHSSSELGHTGTQNYLHTWINEVTMLFFKLIIIPLNPIVYIILRTAQKRQSLHAAHKVWLVTILFLGIQFLLYYDILRVKKYLCDCV